MIMHNLNGASSDTRGKYQNSSSSKPAKQEAKWNAERRQHQHQYASGGGFGRRHRRRVHTIAVCGLWWGQGSQSRASTNEYVADIHLSQNSPPRIVLYCHVSYLVSYYYHTNNIQQLIIRVWGAVEYSSTTTAVVCVAYGTATRNAYQGQRRCWYSQLLLLYTYTYMTYKLPVVQNYLHAPYDTFTECILQPQKNWEKKNTSHKQEPTIPFLWQRNYTDRARLVHYLCVYVTYDVPGMMYDT